MILKTSWPKGIVIFFIVLAVVNASILYLSLTRRPAATTSSPYLSSLTYQQTINRRRMFLSSASKLIWNYSCSTGDCLLKANISNLSEELMPHDIRIKIVRPNDPSMSRALTVVESDGIYLLKIELAKGLWLLNTQFEIDHKQFEDEQKLYVN